MRLPRDVLLVAIFAPVAVRHGEALSLSEKALEKKSSGKWCILNKCFESEKEMHDAAEKKAAQDDMMKKQMAGGNQPCLSLSCDFPCDLNNDGSMCWKMCCEWKNPFFGVQPGPDGKTGQTPAPKPASKPKSVAANPLDEALMGIVEKIGKAVKERTQADN